MEGIAARVGAGPLNALRADILRHAVGKTALEPGLFMLTVPTGGGKTLASLSFALEHAVRHGLDRVIYVIPYTGVRIERGSKPAQPGVRSRQRGRSSRERGSKPSSVNGPSAGTWLQPWCAARKNGDARS